jgi:uncharacterized protein YfeS
MLSFECIKIVTSNFMKSFLVIFLLATLASCEQSQEKANNTHSDIAIDTAHKQKKHMSDYSPEIDKAHPIAKRLMNEEFYWSPIEETAPFGSDDGSDTYAGFTEWRQTHKKENPKIFLMEQINYWGYPSFDLTETDFEKLKPYLKKSDLGTRFMSGIDAAIVAIAFGQLYLEGTIHKEFKDLTITSIQRQLNPKMLSLWGDTYKIKREEQLKKMLAVLFQVK